MKAKTYLTLILLLLYSSSFAASETPRYLITNGVEKWRRLGDNILVICKTKYLSKKFNIPFAYSQFPYHTEFQLSFEERLLTIEEQKKFTKTVILHKEEDLNLNVQEPTLFICHFLTPTPWIYSITREDKAFEEEIKNLFTPLMPLPSLKKASDTITIALHVRKGGGYDKPLASAQEYTNDKPTKGFYIQRVNAETSNIDIWPLNPLPDASYITFTKELLFKKTNFSDYIWPLKFPPDQYYIDQIKYIKRELPGKRVVIYLFTDDPHPEDIARRYKQALDFPVTIEYRTDENHYDKNVLKDLFHMAACDCIISAHSSFAQAAHILGNHSLIIFPVHALTLPDKVFINKIGIVSVENPLNPEKRKVAFNQINEKIK